MIKNKTKFFLILSILLIIIPATFAKQQPTLQLRLEIGKDDSINLKDFKVNFGFAEESKGSNDDYKIVLHGTNNKKKEFYFELDFLILTDPPTEINFARRTLFIPYLADLGYMEVYHKEKVLGTFQLRDQLCNQDGICKNKENHISCPIDCLSYSQDNLCTPIEDEECDPDCNFGDPDCKEKQINLEKFPAYVKYIVIIFIIIFFGFVTYRYLKNKI
ncbi:hypothetical protein J4443_04635 [Candidatus Woesearchaeota archaeon]|nr:hypothetical protein [Candidatus Woesearchaeota archaeon]